MQNSSENQLEQPAEEKEFDQTEIPPDLPPLVKLDFLPPESPPDDAPPLVQSDEPDDVPPLIKSLEQIYALCRQGNSDALYELGNYQLNGLRGFKKHVGRAIDSFKKAAEQNHAGAQSVLYELSQRENPVVKGKLEIIKFLAKKYHCEAMYIVGSDCLFGDEFEKNEASAVKYFQAVIGKWGGKSKPDPEGSVSQSYYYLGYCYSKGLGISKNLHEANQCFTTAYQLFKNLNALNALAELHEQTASVEGIKEVISIYEQLAENKHQKGQFNLGRCYRLGIGVEKDINKTFDLWTPLVTETDSWVKKTPKDNQHIIGEIYNFIGLYYKDGLGGIKDTAKSAHNFHLGAMWKNAEAEYNFSICLKNGTGVMKDIYGWIKFLKLSTSQGYAPALNDLGRCYEKGVGRKKDSKKALLQYQISASRGDAEGLFHLGRCHQDAIGVSKDRTDNKQLAERYFLQSAEKKYAPAMTVLASTNTREAKRFYSLARACGDMDSLVELAGPSISKKSTQEDLREAVGILKVCESQRHAGAQYYLGLALCMGRGIQLNEPRGFELIQLSAKNGYQKAIKFLASVPLNESKSTPSSSSASMTSEVTSSSAKSDLSSSSVSVSTELLTSSESISSDLKSLSASMSSTLSDSSVSMSLETPSSSPIQGATFSNSSASNQLEIKLWFDWAEQGDVTAQNYLGSCYLYGIGVDKDPKKAVHYFQLADNKQGKSAALNYLGECYENGSGEQKNLLRALAHYESAVVHDSTNTDALLNLGKYYSRRGKARNLPTAAKYYDSAATQGNAEAQRKMGCCCEYGNGVGKDLDKALEWYSLAAANNNLAALSDLYDFCRNRKFTDPAKLMETLNLLATKNHLEAMHDLGLAYLNGRGVQKDEKMAVHWCRMAASKGNSNARNTMARLQERGLGQLVPKDVQGAFNAYQKLCDEGHAGGKCNLGRCYQDGIGVKKDPVKAKRLLKSLADKSSTAPAVIFEDIYADSQNLMGIHYKNGLSGVKDSKKSAQYYQLSAERGNAKGQFNVGVCYIKGEGVLKDEKTGTRHLKYAADQGYAPAINSLASCYENGIGVEKDIKEARRLYALSAKKDNAIGKIRLSILQAIESGHNHLEAKGGEAEALNSFQTAGAQGSIDAWVSAADLLLNTPKNKPGDDREAIGILRVCMSLGDKRAERILTNSPLPEAKECLASFKAFSSLTSASSQSSSSSSSSGVYEFPSSSASMSLSSSSCVSSSNPPLAPICSISSSSGTFFSSSSSSTSVLGKRKLTGSSLPAISTSPSEVKVDKKNPESFSLNPPVKRDKKDSCLDTDPGASNPFQPG